MQEWPSPVAPLVITNRTADVLRNRIVELFLNIVKMVFAPPVYLSTMFPPWKDHHIQFTATGLVTRPWKWLPELTTKDVALESVKSAQFFSSQILPLKSPTTLSWILEISLQEIPGWNSSGRFANPTHRAFERWSSPWGGGEKCDLSVKSRWRHLT